MTKAKKIISFILLSFMLAILIISMPAASINVEAASCKCSAPSARTRTIAPTCTTKGYKETYCTKCGGSLSGKTNYTAALGHNKTSTTIKSPTCIAYGQKKITCKRAGCTYSVIESISAYGNHSYTTKTTKAPTCGTAGTQIKYCKVCNKINSTTSIAATGQHSPASTTKVKLAPTCTAVGIEEIYCKNCSQTISERSISKKNHDYSQPSCTEDAKCKTCGAPKKNSKLNHIYSKFVSCDLPYLCTTCGKADPNRPKAGHDLSIEPTCTHNARCARSGCTFEVPGPVQGHLLVTTAATPATCGIPGSKTDKCTRAGCDYSLTSKISATGNHSPATRITKPASCSKAGTKEIYCQICSEIIEEISFYASHLTTTTIQAPTCGIPGTETLRCKNCDYVEVFDIPTTTHSPAKRITKLQTCTTDGIEETYCKICNEILATSSITAKHTFSSPTCSQNARCIFCGLEPSNSKLGHIYAKYVSCDLPYVCFWCGQADPDGSKVGHDLSIPATCTHNTRCARPGCSFEVPGPVPGHTYDPNGWIEPQPENPIVCKIQKNACSRCNIYPTISHVFKDGKCINCGYKGEELTPNFTNLPLDENAAVTVKQESKKIIFTVRVYYGELDEYYKSLIERAICLWESESLEYDGETYEIIIKVDEVEKTPKFTYITTEDTVDEIKYKDTTSLPNGCVFFEKIDVPKDKNGKFKPTTNNSENLGADVYNSGGALTIVSTDKNVGWHINSGKQIKFDSDLKSISEEYFILTIAHEMGHVFGLGDAYWVDANNSKTATVPGVEPNDIMWGGDRMSDYHLTVTDLNRCMFIEAFSKDTMITFSGENKSQFIVEDPTQMQ